ncbi:unnamed protein product [Heterosigma akashiwo]
MGGPWAEQLQPGTQPGRAPKSRTVVTCCLWRLAGKKFSLEMTSSALHVARRRISSRLLRWNERSTEKMASYNCHNSMIVASHNNKHITIE